MHGHHELVPVKRDVKYFQPAVQSMYPLLTYPFYLSTAEVSYLRWSWWRSCILPAMISSTTHHNATFAKKLTQPHNIPFFRAGFLSSGLLYSPCSKCASCYKTCEWGIEQRVDFYKQAKAKTTFWCRHFLLNWFGLLKGNAMIVQGIKRWAPGAPAKHGSSVWTAQ